jgi:hypothetical protein
MNPAGDAMVLWSQRQVPGGDYDLWSRRYRPDTGWGAPEQIAGGRHSERSLVFQLGMLAIHELMGTQSWDLKNRRVGLPRLRSTLKGFGAQAMAGLIASCLSIESKHRPSNYEEVWAKIPFQKLPRPLLEIWRNLREPYGEALGSVGLEAGV